MFQLFCVFIAFRLKGKMQERKLHKLEEEKREIIQKEKIRRSTGKEMVAAKAKCVVHFYMLYYYMFVD